MLICLITTVIEWSLHNQSLFLFLNIRNQSVFIIFRKIFCNIITIYIKSVDILKYRDCFDNVMFQNNIMYFNICHGG